MENLILFICRLVRSYSANSQHSSPCTTSTYGASKLNYFSLKSHFFIEMLEMWVLLFAKFVSWVCLVWCSEHSLAITRQFLFFLMCCFCIAIVPTPPLSWFASMWPYLRINSQHLWPTEREGRQTNAISFADVKRDAIFVLCLPTRPPLGFTPRITHFSQWWIEIVSINANQKITRRCHDTSANVQHEIR